MTKILGKILSAIKELNHNLKLIFISLSLFCKLDMTCSNSFMKEGTKCKFWRKTHCPFFWHSSILAKAFLLWPWPKETLTISCLLSSANFLTSAVGSNPGVIINIKGVLKLLKSYNSGIENKGDWDRASPK